MPLDVDEILGACYLSASDFRKRAKLFGAGMSLADYPDGEEGEAALRASLASASRIIDALCGRDFVTETTISETHRWDARTRRIRVNSPPCLELVSFKIRTSPGTLSTFSVADCYVNNQEGYVELAALSVVGSLTSQLLALGMTEPQVEIQYKSFGAVPQPIVLACGYLTADLINQGFVNQLVPAQFGSLQIGGTKLNNTASNRNFTVYSDITVNHVPPVVAKLLQDFVRIAIA